MPISCIICKQKRISYDNTRTFHRFPKNERVKKIWMEAIGVSIITKNSMICSDHFEEKSYHQTDGYTYLRRLLNNAVPCVNLCNSNSKDLHNSYQTNDVSVFIKEENGPSDFQLQDRAIEIEAFADGYEHEKHTQRNIQSTQTRPSSNAERQKRYRERKKAKMNTCLTSSQSSDVRPHQERPQNYVENNKRQPQSNAERQRKYRKLLRAHRQQQQMENINAVTVLSNIPHRSSIDQLQNVDQAKYARKRRLNQQRQSRFRARQKFKMLSTSSHQAQAEREKNCNELDVSNENSTVFVIKTENTEFFEQPKLELDDNVNQIEICNIKTEHFEENYHTNNSVLISEENIKSENVESNIDTQEMSNEFEIKKELLHSDYELSDLKKEINDFDIEKFNNGSKNRLHSMEATFGNNAAKKSKCTGSEDDAKPKCYYYNSLLQGYVADSINHNDISTKDSAKITEEELSSVTSVENNLQQAQSSIPSLLYYSDIGKCIDPTDEKLVKEPESDKNFLLSCLPILNRLDVKKNQIARRKIQQLLFDIEFSNI